jgi:DNA-binding transcriptional MerR regulator
MAKDYLTTSQIAKATGVHPNTVRLYEAWGFIPQADRTPAGYRRFTELHLDLMRFARFAIRGQYPGKTIRRSVMALVHQAASGDLEGAFQSARIHLNLVQAEKNRAEQAAHLVEAWVRSSSTPDGQRRLQIGQVARLLDVSRDQLRNWERNGLLKVKRASRNGYRLYSSQDIQRLEVVRMLNQSGYSQMAILRMMLQLDQGKRKNLPQVLNTPRPDENPVMAADRWLTTLAEEERRATQLIEQLADILAKQLKR